MGENQTIADIAYIAGYRRYYSGDSRLDMSEFVYWAKEFEEKDQDADWCERDYMIEIEKYANTRIKEARKLQKESSRKN